MFNTKWHLALIAIPTFFGLSTSAQAQFYSGAANQAPGASQTYARGLSGSGDQGANLRNFSVSSYNGGFFGGGGNGGPNSQVATPWSSKYGSWIQPANSGVMQDSIARQQAYFQGSMQNQDLELRRLQLKRAAFDEMMYEKMNTPPPELVREEQRLNRLTRARNTPPESEIALGDPLNELLINIQRIQAREGVRGYSIPLDPDVVKHLNVTTTGGSSVGSNAMFKQDSSLEWPIALSTDTFAPYRKRVEANIADMTKAQQEGRIDLGKVADSRKALGGMKSMLFDVRADTSFTDYAAGLEYLSSVGKKVEILAKPGAKNFIDGTYAAKGSTVGELVDYMTSKGLKFAPATSGYEPYYTGFYQSMVTYDIGLSRLAGDQSTMMFQPPPSKKDQ
ncbi:MAG: hypothetical protein K8T89_07920 [Planctomycetes bacterium]|nr:hypothetical protein [Planctomycetota bacterium]